MPLNGGGVGSEVQCADPTDGRHYGGVRVNRRSLDV